VHRQLIVEELDTERLVAAFTALSDHAPSAADRGQGLFRRCWEIVMSAPPATAGSSPTRR
jgi:hypothetical protein